MATTPLDQVRDCLTRGGLMSPAEFSAFHDALPAPRPTEAQALTAELVKQNKLTAYQATLVAQGQTKGLIFGEYTVLDRLGEGGMGMVYQAQHRYLKRTVALKVLHASVTQSDDAVKRFRREVEAIARLSHPNVVAAFDANQQDGTYYFVMEYVDGTDLSRLVKEQGLLSAVKALDYVLQAARGLEHAHKKGVIHRDIKPSNLVLNAEGQIKILDMGLVRFTDSRKHDGSGEGLTQTGDIMGSFDYIAPEQAIDTKRADQRADVYSLGCTLYFLLVGKPPYSGDTSMQKLLAHRENAIPSLRKARPDVPLSLDAVFHHMVAKKAEDRYAAMSDVVADLEACQAPREATDKSTVAALSLPQPRVRNGTGRLVILCGTACILAVLAAEVLTTYLRTADQPAPDGLAHVQGWALGVGAGMVLLGVVLSVLGSVGSRLVAGQKPQARPGEWFAVAFRWLVGTLAGLLVGAIGGGALGGALALNGNEFIRMVGGTIVGVFVGAALGRRRVWLAILGCGLVGYFAGPEIGRYDLSLESIGIDLRLEGTTVALLGFAAIGAVVGAVLGAERREVGGKRTPEVESKSTPSLTPPAASDAITSGKTVRRAVEHS